MSSQRRIDASRANGAKRRGPVTPQGRHISSLSHGLSANTVLLSNETSERFQQVLDPTRNTSARKTKSKWTDRRNGRRQMASA